MNARLDEKNAAPIVVGHYINGETIEDSTRTAPVMNPATGQMTKQVALASRLAASRSSFVLRAFVGSRCDGNWRAPTEPHQSIPRKRDKTVTSSLLPARISS